MFQHTKQKKKESEQNEVITSVPEPIQSWRGILLASVVILVILGVIVVSIIIVTPKIVIRRYPPLPMDELLELTDDFEREQLIWLTDNNFAFCTSKGIWKIDKNKKEQLLFQFSNERMLKMSRTWISPDQTSWLIESEYLFGSLNAGQRRYEVIQMLNSSTSEVKRITLEYVFEEKYTDGTISAAQWGAYGHDIIVMASGHTFHTMQIDPSKANYGLICLSCSLSTNLTFGKLSADYAGLFNFQNEESIWTSATNPGKLLLLAFEKDDDDLQSNSELSDTQNNAKLVVISIESRTSVHEEVDVQYIDFQKFFSHQIPSNERSLYIVKTNWLNGNSILLMATSNDQRHLWIFMCHLDSPGGSQTSCHNVWHFHSSTRTLEKPQFHDLQPNGNNSFYVSLPQLVDEYTIYRVAEIHMSGKRLQHMTWISPKEYNVETIKHISNESIFYTSSFRVEGSRHLFRFNKNSGVTTCISCQIVINPESPEPMAVRVHRRLASSSISLDGETFSLQWSTGFEGFLHLRLNQSPAAEQQNQLTGAITELITNSEGGADEQKRLVLEPTCYWPADNINKFYQLGVFESPSGVFNATARLIWSRHDLNSVSRLLIPNIVPVVEQPASNINKIRIKRTSGPQEDMDDPQDYFLPHPPLSAKQKHYDDAEAQQKNLHLFDHSELGLPYLLSRARASGESGEEKKIFWAPYSVLRCLTLDPPDRWGDSSWRWDKQPCNVLVRFWYPNKLNEKHIIKYPFLLIVQKKTRSAQTNVDPLLRDLAFHLASAKKVIVAWVEEWLTTARAATDTENPHIEATLYKRLFHTMVNNYHYIDVNKSVIIGGRGAAAHLTGLILASDSAPEVPRCGILIAPIINYRHVVRTVAERYFGSYIENELAYISSDLILKSKRLYDKSIYLVHDYNDPLYPFAQTAELAKSFVQNNVDYELLLHPYGSSGALPLMQRKSILRKISTFIVDCFNKTSNRWNYIPQIRRHDGENLQQP